jgi:AcrR family transcriptional regulator
MARKAKKAPEIWKQEIMCSAQALFAAKGYENTSVSEIMNQTDGAKGTFYLFFESKERLLSELVEQWVQAYSGAMTSALSCNAGTFLQKFKTIIDVIEQMAKRTLGLDAFFHPSNELILHRITKRVSAIMIEPLAELLANGISQGLLQISDPQFYARFIIHGALGALNAGKGRPDQYITENLKQLPLAVANILGYKELGFVYTERADNNKEV